MCSGFVVNIFYKSDLVIVAYTCMLMAPKDTKKKLQRIQQISLAQEQIFLTEGVDLLLVLV